MDALLGDGFNPTEPRRDFFKLKFRLDDTPHKVALKISIRRLLAAEESAESPPYPDEGNKKNSPIDEPQSKKKKKLVLQDPLHRRSLHRNRFHPFWANEKPQRIPAAHGVQP